MKQIHRKVLEKISPAGSFKWENQQLRIRDQWNRLIQRTDTKGFGPQDGSQNYGFGPRHIDIPNPTALSSTRDLRNLTSLDVEHLQSGHLMNEIFESI